MKAWKRLAVHSLVRTDHGTDQSKPSMSLGSINIDRTCLPGTTSWLQPGMRYDMSHLNCPFTKQRVGILSAYREDTLISSPCYTMRCVRSALLTAAATISFDTVYGFIETLRKENSLWVRRNRSNANTRDLMRGAPLLSLSNNLPDRCVLVAQSNFCGGLVRIEVRQIKLPDLRSAWS